MTRVFRGYIAPNPKEFDYWVDLSKDPKGNYIRYYAGDSQWKYINDDTDNPQTAEIETLKNKVATLESKANGLQTKVTTLENKVSTLETKVAALEAA